MGREASDPRIDHDNRTNPSGQNPRPIFLQRCASLNENGVPMTHYVFNPMYRPVTIRDILLFGPLEICTSMTSNYFDSLTPLNKVYPELYELYLTIIRNRY
jgi:hypothetical protein